MPDVLRVPHPVLSAPAAPVKSIDSNVDDIAAELLKTMRETSHSVGVAAPQIGIPLRIFCVDVGGHPKSDSCHGEFVLINPEIIAARKPVVAREGCMSVPDLTGDVARASEAVVSGTTPEGIHKTLEVNAFEARAVLHEIDHLDGKVFLDRLVAADRVFRRKRYR